MKRKSQGRIIAAVVLVLSAGWVWQQQRRTAPPRAAGAGSATTEEGTSAAAMLTPSRPPGGNTSGTPGQETASVVGQAIPPTLPAPSTEVRGAPPPSPRQDPDDAKPTNPMPLEPLISPAAQQSLIARDGTPLRIELSPGQPVTAVELRAWTDDQTRNAVGHYDWRFQIKVPAGGLVERLDPTIFMAPAEGYGADFDFAMDQDVPGNQWANSFGKSFFIHLNNDTYGLLNVQMVAGGAHFVSVKAYLNPALGSRNLQTPPPPPVKAR